MYIYINIYISTYVFFDSNKLQLTNDLTKKCEIGSTSNMNAQLFNFCKKLPYNTIIILPVTDLKFLRSFHVLDFHF